MPFPIKGDYSLHSYHRCVLTRDKLAGRIGLVAAEWAMVESLLTDMFTFSVFALSKEEHAGQRIVRQAMGALDSLNARLDIVEAIIRPRIDATLFEEYVKQIQPELRRRAGERNRVVHSEWHVCDRWPDDLIAFAPGQDPMRYTLKCFDDIAERIYQARVMLNNYWHRVQRSLHGEPPPPPGYPPPPP